MLNRMEPEPDMIDQDEPLDPTTLELPNLTYQELYGLYPQLRSHFDEFKEKQLAKLHKLCFHQILDQRQNMMIISPTNSCKTGTMKMAALKEIKADPGQKGRVVYLCPTVALATQVYNQWKASFQSDGISIYLLAGSGLANYRELGKSNVVIATFDKLLVQIKKKRQDFEQANRYSLIILDEFHEIGMSRGHKYERVVDMIRKMRRSNPRVIAASGTVNKHDLEMLRSWLQVDRRHCHYLLDHRQFWQIVPLRIDVKQYQTEIGQSFDGKTETYAINKYLENRLKNFLDDRYKHYQNQRVSTLIFVPTVDLAKSACLQFQQLQFRTSELASELQDISQEFKDETMLAELIKKGVAYYHAGLSCQYKYKIEKYYIAGKIKLICSTTALSKGVNLGAQLVIVMSIHRYFKKKEKQEENDGAEPQQYLEPTQDQQGYLEGSELRQMLGRARLACPQNGGYAEAYVLTLQSHRQKCEQLLNNVQRIKSRLEDQLPTYLNIEVYSRTFNTLDECVRHFSSSFYYHYLLSSYGDPILANNMLKDRCRQNLEELKLAGCIEQPNGKYSSKPLGEVFVNGHLNIKNVRSHLFRNSIRNIQCESSFLYALSTAIQYEESSRNKSSPVLRSLNKLNHFEYLENQDYNIPWRVCVLVQALLSGYMIVQNVKRSKKIRIESPDLRDEGIKSVETMLNKVLRVFKSILGNENNPNDPTNNLIGYNYALRYSKYLRNRCWPHPPNPNARKTLISIVRPIQFIEENKREFLDKFENSFSLYLDTTGQRKLIIETKWSCTITHGTNNNEVRIINFDVARCGTRLQFPITHKAKSYFIGVVFDKYIGQDCFFRVDSNTPQGKLAGEPDMNSQGEFKKKEDDDKEDTYTGNMGGTGSTNTRATDGAKRVGEGIAQKGTVAATKDTRRAEKGKKACVEVTEERTKMKKQTQESQANKIPGPIKPIQKQK